MQGIRVHSKIFPKKAKFKSTGQPNIPSFYQTQPF